MRLLMTCHRSLNTGSLDQTEQPSFGIVEPVRQIMDAVLLLHLEVTGVISCNVFRCRITEVAVNIHEHRHDRERYTESLNSRREPSRS